jgi:ABC-type antimicrobial peptide transport system permease subunit
LGGSGMVWLFLLGALVVSTLLTGVLPASSMAFFKPLDFLHGYTILRLKNLLLRKGLVVFQFAVGVIFIIVTIVVFRQMQLAQASAAHYNREEVVSLVLPSRTLQELNYDQQKISRFSKTFTDELQDQPSILGMVFASGSIEGSINSNSLMNWYWDGLDTSIKVSISNVTLEPGAKNIFNLQLVEGSWFREDKSDKKNFILNETAVRKFGLRQPVIGQTFARRGQDTGQIIGVIKDYNFSSLYNEIEPMVISDNEDDFKPDFFIKIASRNIPNAMNAIAATWKKNIPDAPFEYQFKDQAFDNLDKDDLKVSKLVLLFSCLSILISALGLFGLAAFVAEQRRKEIGIRKVMGAAVAQIIFMLSKEFLLLVKISVIIASPIGYWIISKWLENFTYKIGVSWWIFVVAGSIVLLISMITVSFHAIRAATGNPVKALRNE